MCSGKSTLCNYIQDTFPDLKFQRTAMAKRLKELAIELFNMDPKIKNRDLLIKLGGKMREINQNVWANYVIKETSQLNSNMEASNWLLDDCRYKNEFDILRENGWIIIKLNVSDQTQKNRLQLLYPNNFHIHQQFHNHVTENEAISLDDSKFDLVLNEDYILNDLIYWIQLQLI